MDYTILDRIYAFLAERSQFTQEISVALGVGIADFDRGYPGVIDLEAQFLKTWNDEISL